MSERNFDRDMLHGCVHVSALSHACIRATPPGGVYRSTPSWTFSATKPERKSVSGDGGFKCTIPPPIRSPLGTASEKGERGDESSQARRGEGE